MQIDTGSQLELVVGNSWGYGTIINDDTPPSIRISDASVVEGNSGTKLMSFTVSLSQAKGDEVRVNFAMDNGTAQDRWLHPWKLASVNWRANCSVFSGSVTF